MRDRACGTTHIDVEEVINEHWIAGREVELVVAVCLTKQASTATPPHRRDTAPQYFCLSVPLQAEAPSLRGVEARDVVQCQAAHDDVGVGYLDVLGGSTIGRKVTFPGSRAATAS